MEAGDDGANERLNIKKAKLEFQQELESYMEEEKLHDISQEMMTACIKEQPADPIQFLIEKMTREESKLQEIKHNYFRKKNHRGHTPWHEGRRGHHEWRAI